MEMGHKVMMCAVFHSRALGPQLCTPHGCPFTLCFPRGPNRWLCPHEHTQRTAWTRSVGAHRSHQPMDGEGYFPSPDSRWGDTTTPQPLGCVFTVAWRGLKASRVAGQKAFGSQRAQARASLRLLVVRLRSCPSLAQGPRPPQINSFVKSWSSSSRAQRRGKQQVATEAAERRSR